MPWLLALLITTVQLLSRLAGHTSPTGFINAPPQPKRYLDAAAYYRWTVYQIYIVVRRLLRRVKSTMLPGTSAGCACCAQIENLDSRSSNEDDYVTLAQLEKAAALFHCEHCGTIGKCIAKFASRWQPRGITSEDVRVDRRKLKVSRVLEDERLLLLRWPDKGVRAPSYPGYGYELLSLTILYGEPTKSRWDNSIGDFQNPVPMNPDSDLCFEFIRHQIENCLLHHKVCGSIGNDSSTPNMFLPTRLVELNPDDPDEIRLIETRSLAVQERRSVSYLALSYCWGDETQLVKPIPKLNKQNVPARLVAIPATELTQTFSDAVRVAHRLGIHHLWLDALCIIQDSLDDFVAEASNMAMIYGTALVVISATRATTGDQGVFHARIPSQEVPYIDQKGRRTTAYVKQAGFHEDFVANDPGDLRRAPVFARAWCFQERLLARRVVHFAEAEVVWECNELVKCECGSLSFRETGLSGGVNFKMRQARRLMAVSPHQQVGSEPDLNVRSALWCECIHTYTSRLLSYESDRLPALSGYARELYVPGMGRYLAGIWEFQLPAVLLWYVMHPRLESAGPGGWVHRPMDGEVPTWSWASIQGVVILQRGYRKKIVARMVEVGCQSKTADPFGRVERGAYIVIEAPVVRVMLVGYGVTLDQWGARPCASIKVIDAISHLGNDGVRDRGENKSDRTCTFLADLYLEQLGHEDHVPVGSHLVCAIIETRGFPEDSSLPKCLVLRSRGSDDASEHDYCRIGVLDCPEMWLDHAKQETFRIF